MLQHILQMHAQESVPGIWAQQTEQDDTAHGGPSRPVATGRVRAEMHVLGSLMHCRRKRIDCT